MVGFILVALRDVKGDPRHVQSNGGFHAIREGVELAKAFGNIIRGEVTIVGH